MKKKRAPAVSVSPEQVIIALRAYFSLASDPGVARWKKPRPILRAKITIRGTQISVLTDEKGVAPFAISDLIGTGRVLDVRPDDTQLSDGPAGVRHGEEGFADAPRFRLRPFSIRLDATKDGISQDPAPTLSMRQATDSPPHALIFSRAARELTVDWKPDWIKSGNRHVEPNKQNSCLVIHQTGGHEIGPPINNFTNANVPTSIHYIVDTDGHAVKLVHESERVNHTGPAFWLGSTNLNAESIGIETVHKDKPPHPFDEAQYLTLLRLVREIQAAHPQITRQRVVGHSDIACESTSDRTISGRRAADPGQEFDWARFEEAGLVRRRAVIEEATSYFGIAAGEYWDCVTKISKPTSLKPDFLEIKQALSSIGYSVARKGCWHQPTSAANQARTHFPKTRRERIRQSGVRA
jgi:N-acetyl-anhydromuramyl-L-alanine amidase AmpD